MRLGSISRRVIAAGPRSCRRVGLPPEAVGCPTSGRRHLGNLLPPVFEHVVAGIRSTGPLWPLPLLGQHKVFA